MEIAVRDTRDVSPLSVIPSDADHYCALATLSLSLSLYSTRRHPSLTELHSSFLLFVSLQVSDSSTVANAAASASSAEIIALRSEISELKLQLSRQQSDYQTQIDHLTAEWREAASALLSERAQREKFQQQIQLLTNGAIVTVTPPSAAAAAAAGIQEQANKRRSGNRFL